MRKRSLCERAALVGELDADDNRAGTSLVQVTREEAQP
jgi:hypothetical protein